MSFFQPKGAALVWRKNKSSFEGVGGFLVEDEEGPSEPKRRPPLDTPDFTGPSLPLPSSISSDRTPADPASNIDVGELRQSEAGFPLCLQCDAEFPTSFYYDHFGHPLCDACKWGGSKEPHQQYPNGDCCSPGTRPRRSGG